MANFCTLNPLSSRYMTLSSGNLTAVSRATGDASIIGTHAAKSGKWYFEYTYNAGQHPGSIGFTRLEHYYTAVRDEYGLVSTGDLREQSYFIQGYGGNVYAADTNAVLTGVGALSSGDVAMFALDLDNNKVWFGANGTWYNSGDPASGSNAIDSNVIQGTYAPIFGDDYGSDTSGGTFNFGQFPFRYDPPSGFVALSTENLAEPPISNLAAEKPEDYFNTVLYTGNGSTQSINGVGFQPDFVWIKERSQANDHVLIDAVRGIDRRLESNNNDAEVTMSPVNLITSLDSDGFSLGSNGNANENTETYVAWCWKAGGTAVENTDGSITSTVSANTTSGFSIFTYTGTGAAGTVGHGLGVTPDMIIFKGRNTTSDWPVYHEVSSDGTLGFPLLNSSGANVGNSPFTWNSSVFTFTSSSSYSNTSGTNYIAYAFNSVEGFSKIGSYTGNGSTDGPFVYTGFRPAFVMVKRTDSTANWQIYDTGRDLFNSAGLGLSSNGSAAESDGGEDFDILSNGFKARDTAGARNGSGGTYIYMAFAESPFKYSSAR